jgi:hypothetical protein
MPHSSSSVISLPWELESHGCMYVCMYIRMYVCVCVCVCVFVCVYLSDDKFTRDFDLILNFDIHLLNVSQVLPIYTRSLVFERSS